VRPAHAWWAFITLVAGVLAVLGCGRENGTELAVEPSAEAGADATRADAGEDADGAPEDGGQDAPRDAPVEGSIARVMVGLTPTPMVTDGGGASVADAVLAALSAGADALVLERAWSDLDEQGGEGFDNPWEQLDAVCRLMAEQRRGVLLSIKTVDARLDLRPSGIAGSSWAQPATRQAMHEVIDKVYATCGDELLYLSLGMEVDQFLKSHPLQSPQFVQFALDAIDYARSHAARPASLQTGWTWTAETWLADGGTNESDVLVAASDVVMLSYTLLDAQHHALPPSTASSDLDAIAGKIVAHPIVIQRASYPSDELIGGSENNQAMFVETLLAWVGSHRDRFAFVGGGPVHDPVPMECVQYAASQGMAGSAELFAAWCSVGLRRRDGSDKPAFDSFLAGAAALDAD